MEDHILLYSIIGLIIWIFILTGIISDATKIKKQLKNQDILIDMNVQINKQLKIQNRFLLEQLKIRVCLMKD